MFKKPLNLIILSIQKKFGGIPPNPRRPFFQILDPPSDHPTNLNIVLDLLHIQCFIDAKGSHQCIVTLLFPR